ncbi:MAG: hypothetical protein DRH57_03120 [Candidatus Cloacimonadota bacterium]|nr:MAG: hypothetical protein DRH57_03120 [Candidatus Cloacimonadota bacterium]
MNDLEINKIYLLQRGFFQTFNKDYFESIIPMVHTHTTHRMDDGERFYFMCPLDDIYESVDEWSISSNVFEDEDAFLKFSVYEASRINVQMDDYFKDLVEQSKLKYPEKWI